MNPPLVAGQVAERIEAELHRVYGLKGCAAAEAAKDPDSDVSGVYAKRVHELYPPLSQAGDPGWRLGRLLLSGAPAVAR